MSWLEENLLLVQAGAFVVGWVSAMITCLVLGKVVS